MTIKNTLGAIALGTALLTSPIAKANAEELTTWRTSVSDVTRFDDSPGVIITFERILNARSIGYCRNNMIVEDPMNGVTMEFVDYDNDLLIDRYTLSGSRKGNFCKDNPLDQKGMEEGQRLFDMYLEVLNMMKLEQATE